MWNNRAFIRRAALWVAGFPISAVAAEFCVAVATELGWFSNALQKVTDVTGFLSLLVASPWFHWVGGVAMGFAAGVWFDAFLRKKEQGVDRADGPARNANAADIEKRAAEEERQEIRAAVLAEESFLDDLERVREEAVEKFASLRARMTEVRNKFSLGMIERDEAESEVKPAQKELDTICTKVENSIFSDALEFSPYGVRSFALLNKTSQLGDYHHGSHFISLYDAGLDATIKAREKYINKTIDEARENIEKERSKLLQAFYLSNKQN
jgi:hypothetical protein